jgi:hypothetical protein
MTSTLPKGTLGSVASLLAATLYQGNPDRNHKLWNIEFRYINDVLSLNISRFGDFVDCIYPIELEIKDTTDDISFRELFGRIRVVFYKIRFVSS